MRRGPRRGAYFEQLRAKVAETPGVTMASISSNATPPSSGWFTKFEILGKNAMEEQMASVDLVSPGYFATLRIPVIEGRIWNETETRNGGLLAVINRTTAQRYFPKGDAIGSSLKLPGIEDRPPAELSVPKLADSWLLIVGIVGDSRNDGLRNPIRPAIYVPYTLHMSMGTQILVRSQVSPVTLVHAVRVQLSAVNPDQQAYGTMNDLETWISDEPEWQQEHLVSWIFGGFAGLALALSAAGFTASSPTSWSNEQTSLAFGWRWAHNANMFYGSCLRLPWRAWRAAF
jgi:hypothetical protein